MNKNGSCDAGHEFGISLKCQIENCAFATKPVPIGFMGLAHRRLSYHMTASHPSVNTGTDQDHNHAGGLQAEKDKGVHNLQNEASKEEQETDWNEVDDDPHNENPCEE